MPLPDTHVVRPASSCLLSALAALALVTGLQVSSPAAAQSIFVPPSPYPAEKYESGWRKNPFTLKTAPTAVQRESFAKNLALGSMYDDAEGITNVVVVNTKTRERTRLKGREPGTNGLRVEEAVIADTRRDSYAVVIMGGEKATLRYDVAFLKQMSAMQGGASAGQNMTNGGAANPKDPANPRANGTANEGAAGGMTAPGHVNGQPSNSAAPPNLVNPAGGAPPVPGPPGMGAPSPPGGQAGPMIPARRRLTVPNQVPPAPPPPTENP